MPDDAYIEPQRTLVQAATGVMENATRHYEKRLKDLDGLYQDQSAFDILAAQDRDTVVYEVWDHSASDRAGDLVFGTSVMKPGKIGREYFMTRGHIHALADRSEIYHCVAGHGVMLMENPDGAVRTLEMTPGSVAYVPPHWTHRSVNVGDGTLVTVFCYSADAGQDYSPIERAGGMRQLVVDDDAGGWTLERNPRHRSSHG